MRLIPVLDVLNRQVVRGIAGRRSEYRPLASRLTSSCRPDEVAAALASHFGFTEFYVADLDAIAGADVARTLITAMHERGFRLWLDAGIVDDRHARAVAQLGVECVVVGLETVAGPNEVERIVTRLGERVVFSLDMKAGAPMGHVERWRTTDAFGIVEQAIELGVRHILVLDLARVGVGDGTGTEDLCARLTAAFPHVEFSAGGGVRDVSDLRHLRYCGVQNVLIASALHDGGLKPDDLAGL
jgi:phosphoribosylformimino-5-aminoimidazole carboxamide ribotide isomerase